mgnify:CR=1 FL=1|tara:strand:- start:10444 stop:11010 length:567 start_codon:yes stop_codon:yes gene_type:complete
MTKKEAMNLIASHYNRIKKIVLMSEKKYFPNNKGLYHEDITQDLYLKIHKELEKIPNNKNEITKFLDRYIYGQAYIYQSIKQILINTFRRESKYTRLDYLKLSENEKKYLVQKIDKIQEETIQDKVDKYVDTFYWFDKKVFNLYRYEFKTHPTEMSKQTKLSESTIYRTVKRCKIKINEKLKRDYYDK